MLFNEFKSLLEQLKNSLSCPNCRGKYDEQGMSILGTFRDESFIHLSCTNCKAQALVTAVINRHNEKRPHQGLKIRNVSSNISPITANEVIEVHNFLQTFDGSFKSLFS